MKRYAKYWNGFVVLAVVALAMATAACSLDTGMTGRGGSLVIRIGSANSRTPLNEPSNTTITPEVMNTISTFKITATGPEGESFSAELAKGVDNTLTKTNLAVGAWTITVEGQAANKAKIASGSKTATILNNQSTTFEIQLKPITDGTGTFAINAAFDGVSEGGEPAAQNAVTGSIYKAGTWVTDFAATWSETDQKYKYSKTDLAPGTDYTVLVTSVNKLLQVATNFYAMNIYGNLTSTLSMSYTADSFRNGSGTGSISITVQELVWNPAITFGMKVGETLFDPATDTLTPGTDVTVTATISEAPNAENGIEWYLDGVKQAATGLEITVGSTLEPGTHVLTLLTRKTYTGADAGTYLASDEVFFRVVKPQN
jgi:hypothetical protein